jgi:hypothetical protein
VYSGDDGAALTTVASTRSVPIVAFQLMSVAGQSSQSGKSARVAPEPVGISWGPMATEMRRLPFGAVPLGQAVQIIR